MRKPLIVLLTVSGLVITTLPLLCVAQGQPARSAGWNVSKEYLEGPDYLQPPKHYRTLKSMLAEAGMIEAPLGPPPVPVFGTREILVILVELSDVTPDAAHTTAYFDGRFFDTSPPSVADYYSEVSYGNFTYVRGDVLGWYTSTYDQNQWDNVDSRPVVVEAIQDVDADFDFAPYDANSDGVVTNDELTIFIIVSGDAGGAFHWYTTSTVATGDGVDVEGEFCATHEERHIGSYCHELGHDLGLPDLYDTDDTVTGDSEGIGQYGLMGGGSWTFSHMTAWSKIQLGWLTPTIVTASGYYDLDDVETNAEAYILVDPTHSTTEYFLVENRHSANSYYETVGAPIAPDGTLPDDGIVIYHVDDTMAEDWINSGVNNVNVDETQKCVDVETAEHQTSHVVDADDLDAEVNRGDSDDLWDCGEYDLDAVSTPCNSVWYGGGANEISVRLLPCVDPTMTVYLTVTNEPPVAACQDISADADENCCIVVDVTDIDAGSFDPDGDDDIQSLCITAVDGSPVACEQQIEVCDAGTHTVTLTITDWFGLSDSCDATVEVLDVTPPSILVELNRDVLWPPNHKMADIVATVTVEDNCDADPTCALTSITSNEPDDGGGDGHTEGDIQGADYGTPDTQFQLRSERSGGGDGRIYTIVYTATDASGNTAEFLCEVRVPHDHAGWALASVGFDEDGADFFYPEERFVLVIRSLEAEYGVDESGNPVLIREAFPASELDVRHVYVGNTAGAVRPVKSELLDIDGNGLQDLAVTYPMAEVVRIKEISLDIFGGDGEVVYDLRTHGPVGLHYCLAGADYRVDSIFELGEPVPLIDVPAPLPPEDVPAEGTELLSQAGLPRVTTITSVRPNPFNPATTIEFYLKVSEPVNLRVYDSRGKLVRTLVEGILPTGQHDVQWDGRDRNGNQVAAGVYLAHLNAGELRQTRKLVMVK